MPHPYQIEEEEYALSRMSGWAGEFATYRDALIAYGCDLPEDLEYEMSLRAEEEAQRELDDLEINGPRFRVTYPDDEIPF